MAFWSWSKTAGSNATADSSINWAEGQSPSSINDSARAMMARTAEWRDDVSGTITTGGTSTAYTVTSNQVFTTLALMNGAMIAFVPHATNGATVTLNVDGLGAKPLRSSPSVEIGAGVLVQGTPYVVTYNNSDAAFYLQGFTGNPFNIPVGGIMPYVGTTAPNSNFAMLNGQLLSRTTYAALFALTGTAFGIGDGSTTFNIPDLRGRAPFGLDAMGGSGAIGRISVAGGNFDATIMGATGGAQSHTLTSGEMPAHVHSATSTVDGNPTIFLGPGTASAQSGAGANNPTSIGSIAITTSIASTGGGGGHTVLSPAIVLPYILRII